MTDVGGVGFGLGATDVFNEGLYLPLIRFARNGVFDETVMRIIRANTRTPDMVDGDIHFASGPATSGARCGSVR